MDVLRAKLLREHVVYTLKEYKRCFKVEMDIMELGESLVLVRGVIAGKKIVRLIDTNYMVVQ